MNKDISELQKEGIILLSKKESFQIGRQKILQLREEIYQLVKNLFESTTQVQMSLRPFSNLKSFESKTIAYSIYHITRIEDIVSNVLIRKTTDIFSQENYQKRLNSSIITTGNELQDEKIEDFSKQLEIEELFNYYQEVYQSTNQWLNQLTFQDLKTKLSLNDKNRLEKLNFVDPSQSFLLDYWCNKDILGLIKVPFSRHLILHVEASLKILNKINSK